MRLLSRSCLLLLAAGLCTSASATNVYQWKDAKGVLHSSDKPPPGQKYVTRRIDPRGQTVDTAPVEKAAPKPRRRARPVAAEAAAEPAAEKPRRKRAVKPKPVDLPTDS